MKLVRYFMFVFLLAGFSISSITASEEQTGYSTDPEFTKATKFRRKYELAICAIFQNEAPYLKEWIEFHRLVGVERFYLFSNLSTDNYQEVLQPYIDANIVEMTEWPFEITSERPWYTIQCDAYTTAIRNTKKKVKWLAFIDIDEFIVPVQHDLVTSVLQEFEEFGGVGVNWQLYGTSHVQKIPDSQLLIEVLLWKGATNRPSNHHVKSIVQPKYVQGFQNAHTAMYKIGYFQVDENGVPFSGPQTENISINKLRLNHYWTRDEDYFYNVKIASRKKRGWSVEKDIATGEKLSAECDPIILKFVPELRKRMGLD